MYIKVPSPRRLRITVLAACAVVLAWLVVTRSFAAYLAGVSPQWALLINREQPEALANLADHSINATQTALILAGPAGNGLPEQRLGPGAVAEGSAGAVADRAPGPRKRGPDGAMPAADNAESSKALLDSFRIVDRNRSVDVDAVRAQAKAALANDPLNARDLRILGQLADISDDNVSASKFMQAAANTSLHESIAVLWLLRKSTESGDYQAAIRYADALLRTDPGLARSVVPALAHFAEDRASNGSIKTLLKANPPWRGLFFALLPDSITDARTPLDLLMALKGTPAPPTAQEASRYIEFLVQHKFYELAYYTWLQFLPAAELRSAGLLFNGNFEVSPSGEPFNWVITQGSGVTVDIVPAPAKDAERALLVDFLYGRVDYHSVTELVALAPGSYQFDGEYQGKLVGSRGLQWRIVCADDPGTQIGESAMIDGVAPSWTKIEFAFAVPAANCRAQYVRLDLDARTASEQLVSGSVLFDDLHISRAAGPPPKSAD